MATWQSRSWHWFRGHAKVAEIFGADLRSLAALRIVLALIALADLAYRSQQLFVFYSDGGAVPRSVQVDQVYAADFSLNFINGTVAFQAVIFLAAAIAAVAMLVGYRTRLAVIALWVLVVSIQWRNFYIGSSGDNLFRLLLFWCMFLPLGDYWSIDRRRGVTPPRATTQYLSMATVALFLQIAFVYWFTAILKSGPEWRVDGTAIYYALSARDLAKPLGTSLLQFPDFLRVMTFGTLALEVIAPLMLFSPVKTSLMRTVAVFAIMSLHLGIWLTMSIGFFPWVSAGCLVCFLPVAFWDAALPRVRRAFDAVAGRLQAPRLPAFGPARAHFAGPTVGFAGASGAPFASLAGAAPGSVPLHTGEVRTVTAGERLPVAEALRETPRRFAGMARPLIINVLATLFLVYVFFSNLSSVTAFTMPAAVTPIGNFFGLDQVWPMFAPYPVKATNWWMIPGTLADGRQIDLLLPTIRSDPYLYPEINWGVPNDVRATFNNDDHWKLYLVWLTHNSNDDLLLNFGRYVCRTWNAAHQNTESQLLTFDIVNVWQPTLENNQRGDLNQNVLWSHVC